MNTKGITVVTRVTPEEHYRLRHGIQDLDELLDRGVSKEEVDDKKEKTEAQNIFIEDIKRDYGISDEQFIKEYEIKENTDTLQKSQMVIAFGGDTTFTLVSQHVGDAPLMGLKGDGSSVGGLLYYTRSNFKQAMDEILKTRNLEGLVEEWPRLQATVNGAEFAKATTQYRINATFPEDFMTKFDIEYKKVKESTECSGIIVCTGAGSRGQARSETWHLGKRAKPFRPTEKRARWSIVAPFSPYKYWTRSYHLHYGDMEQGDELIIKSRCKMTTDFHAEFKLEPGKISSDALVREFFKEGTEIRVRLADDTLKVVNVPGISYERWS